MNMEWETVAWPPPTAPIQTFSDRSFQYDNFGREALLCPVVTDCGKLIDTVGWFSKQPAHWWLERKIATHLGDRALGAAAFFRRPICLRTSPAAWLASPKDAMVVLDWDSDLRVLFSTVSEVCCATTGLKRHLDQYLAKQVRPGFWITSAAA
jgi:hypothetical protein